MRYLKHDHMFITVFFFVYERVVITTGVRMSRWRGLDGSTRRLVVTKYDDEEENVKETALEGKQKGDRHAELRQHTTHYAIYEHSVDNKKKKLYRHFLMLSEGAVIEIFDKHQPVVAPRASTDDEEVRDTGADLVVSRDIMNSYKQSVKR